MLNVAVAGAQLSLLSCGAAFLSDEATLLVADAHLGKARSFRLWGVPVPEETTAQTLDAISSAIRRTGARRLVFLGDFLHSARGRSADLMAALAAWRERHSDVAISLVRGNHDARAGDPPPGLGLSVVDEPLRLGPFALCHHPFATPGPYVIAGHWHPCVRIGAGFDQLRLPCFWFGDDNGKQPQHRVGVLPAYGAFTGMHRIDRRPADRVFVLADGAVRALPTLRRA